MAEFPTLDCFATELLLHIFKYLDIPDFARLRVTCHRFCDIIDNSRVLYKNENLIVAGYDSTLNERTYKTLSHYQRCRVSHNWRKGAASQRSLLPEKSKFMPWLHLERDTLWISKGANLKLYERSDRIMNTQREHMIIIPRNSHDICRFVVKNGFVLAGQMTGNMFLWSLTDNSFIFDWPGHVSDINDVDMISELIVTASRDNTVKVWTEISREVQNMKFITIDMKEQVWAVALNKQNLLAVGTAGTKMSCLEVYDLTQSQVLHKILAIKPPLIGAGTKQIKWETPQLFWTCGYDAYTRKWDLRCQRSVQNMCDPCESTIYCFDTDFKYSLLAGCQSNGRAVLWDTRKSSSPAQMYYMNTCKGRWSSPIYSIAYDHCYLFAATAHHLNVLDFTANAASVNYSNWIA